MEIVLEKISYGSSFRGFGSLSTFAKISPTQRRVRVLQGPAINFHLFTFSSLALRKRFLLIIFLAFLRFFLLPENILNTPLFTSFFGCVFQEKHKNLWTHFSTEMGL